MGWLFDGVLPWEKTTFSPRLWIPIALALLLTACFGPGPNRIDIACESASSVTYVLAVMKARGQLSPLNRTRVDQAVDLIDPICGADLRPTTTAALDTVNRALFILNGVKMAPQRPTGG